MHSDIVDYLRGKQIIIYGAGNNAMRFYHALLHKGLASNIKTFAVTRRGNKQQFKMGISVRCIYDIVVEENDIVCLAVHETQKCEMEKVLLNELKTENYIWIAPYFSQLWPIELIHRAKYISLKDIIRTNDDYRFAIRYLAVENYYSQNTYGFDIYQKAMQLCCDPETAKKRIDFFCDMISGWEQYGYNSDKACWIDLDFKLIEGAHRTTLAIYYGQKEIVCDVYNDPLSIFSEMLPPGDKMVKGELIKAQFSENEWYVIEDAYNRIRERV